MTEDADPRKEDDVDRNIQKVIKKVDKKLIDGIVPVIPVSSGVGAPEAPAMVDGDKSEPPISEKLRYAETLLPAGHKPLQIQTEITQKDIDIIKRKAYVATLRDFDDWLIKTYLGGVNDQVKRAWLLEVYPGWFERQTEAISKLNDVKKKYELMKIDGPKSIEDIYFMYVYERDLHNYDGSLAYMSQKGILGIMSPNDYYAAAGQDPAKPNATEAETFYQKSFERGLFNTRKRNLEMFNVWMFANQNMGANADLSQVIGPKPDKDKLEWAQTLANKMPYILYADKTNPKNIAQLNAQATGLASSDDRIAKEQMRNRKVLPPANYMGFNWI